MRLKFLLLPLIYWLISLNQTAYGEGSAQVGANQRTQRGTLLYLDILASGEEIHWSGTGELQIVDPEGVMVASLASDQHYVCSSIGSYALLLSQDQVASQAWDISVPGTSAGFGRLYSTLWKFDAGTYAEAYAANGSFYALVSGGEGTDTAVVELRLDGLSGFRYSIGANATGVAGASAGRSVSIFGNSFVPEYRLYLSPPEIANYQTSEPEVTNFTYVGSGATCSVFIPGDSVGSFEFNSNVNGTFHLVCDTNQDGIFDPVNNSDTLIVGSAVIGSNRAEWDGTTSGGDTVALGSYGCNLSLGVGELHYVGDDIETSYAGLRMFSVTPIAGGGFERSGLTMYWNDTSVQNNAVLMGNGEYGFETSGQEGLDSGLYSDPAVANLNARAWGEFPEFFGSGKGDRAYLDTFANLDTTVSGSIQIEAVDGSTDCDGDGVSDFEEECMIGSAACQSEIPGDSRDSDGDGVCDGPIGFVGVCLEGPDSHANDRYRCMDGDGDLCDDCSGGTVDTFADGPDRDHDGICDRGEDTDGDGVVDGIDMDDDNDGIDDEREGLADVDGDGLPNLIDLDSDGDGILDRIEGQVRCASDGPDDGRCYGSDLDGDGLVDAAEKAAVPDTDGDGIVDFLDLDSDNDGASDLFEGTSNCVDLAPSDWICDTPDVNQDGWGDGLSPNSPNDFDGDGVPDYIDLDSDNDGLMDRIENGSDCTDLDENAVCDQPDSDGDGAIDSIDFRYGHGTKGLSLPLDRDSDGRPDYIDWHRDGDEQLDARISFCENINPMDWMCDGSDEDRDGIVDGEDGFVGFGRVQDTDGDGVANIYDDDDDGDGITDFIEGSGLVDSDGDGVVDSLDLDSDNDGILDLIEARHHGRTGFSMEIADTDGDGDADYRDLDSDGDGISDRSEADSNCVDSQEDGVCDGEDRDGDGLVGSLDQSLGFGSGTQMLAPIDTDQVGLPDFQDLDSDGDGILDRVESDVASAGFSGTDSDSDGIADQRELDSDSDGLPDSAEAGDDFEHPVDTDGDGLRDFQDVDSDNDGVLDDRDNCPVDVNPLQIDVDDNGIGRACDEMERAQGHEDKYVSDSGGCSTSDSPNGAFLFFVFVVLWNRRKKTGMV